MFKVFDSNIHLTSTDQFKEYKRNIPCNFSEYKKSYSGIYSLEGCLYSGIPNLENYSLDNFKNKFETIKTQAFGFPAITKTSIGNELIQEIQSIKRLNFKGCKVHPKQLRINYSFEFLSEIIKILSKNNLYFMLCTYLGDDKYNSNFEQIIKILDYVKDEKIDIKIVLAHGGGKFFKYFSDYIFINKTKNILIDLSFTYLRYINTKIENQILNSIASNNKFISFGTDWPDYSFSENIETLNKHRRVINNDVFFQNFLYNNSYNFLNDSA